RPGRDDLRSMPSSRPRRTPRAARAALSLRPAFPRALPLAVAGAVALTVTACGGDKKEDAHREAPKPASTQAAAPPATATAAAAPPKQAAAAPAKPPPPAAPQHQAAAPPPEHPEIDVLPDAPRH